MTREQAQRSVRRTMLAAAVLFVLNALGVIGVILLEALR